MSWTFQETALSLIDQRAQTRMHRSRGRRTELWGGKETSPLVCSCHRNQSQPRVSVLMPHHSFRYPGAPKEKRATRHWMWNLLTWGPWLQRNSNIHDVIGNRLIYVPLRSMCVEQLAFMSLCQGDLWPLGSLNLPRGHPLSPKSTDSGTHWLGWSPCPQPN